MDVYSVLHAVASDSEQPRVHPTRLSVGLSVKNAASLAVIPFGAEKVQMMVPVDA
jgi:hypothetical protein